MEAAFKRNIINIDSIVDRYFPKSKGTETTLQFNDAGLNDTIALIKNMLVETKSDSALLARDLVGKSLKETLKNNWTFLYYTVQYKLDEPGIEQIRRPSRTISDRKSGVDCDCMTMFLSTVLDNQGINHVLRIAKYKGNKEHSHIYIVVPKNGNVHQVNFKKDRANYYVLDCVPDAFDFEAPNLVHTIDIPREVMNTKNLSGLGAISTTTVTPLKEFIFPEIEGEKAISTNSTSDIPGPVSFTQPTLTPTQSPIVTEKPLKKASACTCVLWLLGGVAGGLTIAAIVTQRNKKSKPKDHATK